MYRRLENHDLRERLEWIRDYPEDFFMHPIYLGDIEQLGSDEASDASLSLEQRGWRFLHRDEEERSFAVDFYLHPDSQRYHFGGLNTGQLCESVIQFLETASSEDKQHFAFVTIPEINQNALWVKKAEGHFFLPLKSHTSTHTLCAEADFFADLSRFAAHRLRFIAPHA